MSASHFLLYQQQCAAAAAAERRAIMENSISAGSIASTTNTSTSSADASGNPNANVNNNNNNNNNNATLSLQDPTLPARLFGSETANRRFLPWNRNTMGSLSSSSSLNSNVSNSSTVSSAAPADDVDAVHNQQTNASTRREVSSKATTTTTTTSAADNKARPPAHNTTTTTTTTTTASNNSSAHNFPNSITASTFHSTVKAPTSLLGSILGATPEPLHAATLLRSTSAPTPSLIAQALASHMGQTTVNNLNPSTNLPPERHHQFVVQRRGEAITATKQQQQHHHHQQQQQKQSHAAVTESTSRPRDDDSSIPKSIHTSKPPSTAAQQSHDQQQPTTPKSSTATMTKRQQMVVDERIRRIQKSPALMERITVPIPREFCKGCKGNCGNSAAAVAAAAPPAVAAACSGEDDDGGVSHGGDSSYQSLLRSFTRRADIAVRQSGVVLLKKQSTGSIFSKKMLTGLRQAATSIQNDVLARLEQAGKVWNSATILDNKRNDTPAAAAADDDGDCDDENDNHSTAPVLENPYSPEYDFSYHEVASRCLGRLDIRHGMDQPPFSNPEVIHNPLLMSVIHSLLGESAKLVHCGLLLSFPGSTDQPWHQDGQPLFPEEQQQQQQMSHDSNTTTSSSSPRDYPPFAINVLVPITPIDTTLGPTEFWVGSHKESRWERVQRERKARNAMYMPKSTFPNQDNPSNNSNNNNNNNNSNNNNTVPEDDTSSSSSSSSFLPMEDHIVGPALSKGDVLVYDYRMCHRGVSNFSETIVRPLLYLIYARPWYAEKSRFGPERLYTEGFVTTTTTTSTGTTTTAAAASTNPTSTVMNDPTNSHPPNDIQHHNDQYHQHVARKNHERAGKEQGGVVDVIDNSTASNERRDRHPNVVPLPNRGNNTKSEGGDGNSNSIGGDGGVGVRGDTGQDATTATNGQLLAGNSTPNSTPSSSSTGPPKRKRFALLPLSKENASSKAKRLQ